MRCMKSAVVMCVAALVTVAVWPGSDLGSLQFPQVAPAEAQSQTQAAVYKPPLRGAPGGRVGGGTRGIPRDTFVLSVLAPDHTGLTVSEQPTLYWFISKPTSLPVEITVTEPRATKPALELRLPAPTSAGVHDVKLADHGVQLKPGVAYRWHVTVVPDPDRRSRDILAGGTIERIEAAEPLRTKLAQARREEVPAIYAEAGLWYDAVASISELIASAPQDAGLQKQRAGLLGQVGLPEIPTAP